MTPIRWGILGLGKIARKFALGLQSVPDAALVAVGSRSMEKASAFAAEFKVPRAYDSYEALTADPEVDVIYIATPHPQHHEAALLCMKAGKAVLLEKPFTVNAREAGELIEVARHEHMLVLPATDVHDAQSKAPWVMVAENGRARHRPVKLGLVGTRMVEILDGLRESENVIPATVAISDGARIRARIVPATAQANKTGAA